MGVGVFLWARYPCTLSGSQSSPEAGPSRGVGTDWAAGDVSSLGRGEGALSPSEF